MEKNEREIPRFVFEDLLFERRLCRTLNAEQERLNALLAEHVRLLEARRKLMAEVHEAVEKRWRDEEQSPSDTHTKLNTEGDGNAD